MTTSIDTDGIQPAPRARWRRRRWLWIALAAFVIGVQLWGWVWEPAQLVQRDYALALPRWSPQCDGLRVDVLADLHTGSPQNGVGKLDRIVREVVAGDADVVLLAGDYVILSVFLGTYVPPEIVARHLRPLAARKPVYAVLGNHDWWKDGDKVRRALESVGITVLDNQNTLVRVRNCRFHIAGIGDLWEGQPDPAKALTGIDAASPVLALTHNPDIFPQVPARPALTIAGHTHGGQVHLPLLGRPVLPVEQRYAIGHIVEDGRHLFVSPGLGTSIVPVRFRVPPEVSRLTLRSEATQWNSGSANSTAPSTNDAVSTCIIGVLMRRNTNCSIVRPIQNPDMPSSSARPSGVPASCCGNTKHSVATPTNT